MSASSCSTPMSTPSRPTGSSTRSTPRPGRGDDAVVLELDTPGGLLTSMRQITQAELRSPIPVHRIRRAERRARRQRRLLRAAGLRSRGHGARVQHRRRHADRHGRRQRRQRSARQADPRRRGADALPRRRQRAQRDCGRAGGGAQERRLPALPAQLDGRRGARGERDRPHRPPTCRRCCRRATAASRCASTCRSRWPEPRSSATSCRCSCGCSTSLLDPNLITLLFLGGILGIAFELTHPGIVLPGLLGTVALLLALLGLSIVPFSWAGIGSSGLRHRVAGAGGPHPGARRVRGGGDALAGARRPDAVPRRRRALRHDEPVARARARRSRSAVFAMLVVNRLMRVRRLPPRGGGASVVGQLAERRVRPAPERPGAPARRALAGPPARAATQARASSCASPGAKAWCSRSSASPATSAERT